MNENVNKNSGEMKSLPIIYSLRNCPYAMRARIAIFKAQKKVMLRDLVLSNKPEEMMLASPKGTVPVVVLENGTVIEESLEVMLWALQASDPNDLLHVQQEGVLSEMLSLINQFDNEFKGFLEQYRCAKRYQEDNVEEYRVACQQYLNNLEERLTKHTFIMSNKESLADIALLPFIRQFARVERQWYLQSPYPQLRQWLNNYLQSRMFSKVMTKHPLWLDSHEAILLGTD
jgi:glutathione S-transferase